MLITYFIAVVEFRYNEIEQFSNIRNLSPPAVMYRLLKFPMYSSSHVIYRLAGHLENKQIIYFKEGWKKNQ